MEKVVSIWQEKAISHPCEKIESFNLRTNAFEVNHFLVNETREDKTDS